MSLLDVTIRCYYVMSLWGLYMWCHRCATSVCDDTCLCVMSLCHCWVIIQWPYVLPCDVIMWCHYMLSPCDVTFWYPFVMSSCGVTMWCHFMMSPGVIMKCPCESTKTLLWNGAEAEVWCFLLLGKQFIVCRVLASVFYNLTGDMLL